MSCSNKFLPCYLPLKSLWACWPRSKGLGSFWFHFRSIIASFTFQMDVGGAIILGSLFPWDHWCLLKAQAGLTVGNFQFLRCSFQFFPLVPSHRSRRRMALVDDYNPLNSRMSPVRCYKNYQELRFWGEIKSKKVLWNHRPTSTNSSRITKNAAKC